MKQFSLFLLLFTLIVLEAKSQCTSPPNGTSCLCSNAPILCDPNDLDGFSFTMASTNNQGGVPSNDLCPGNNPVGNANNGNVPNNVNWFAFRAWCVNLTINVAISNCTAGSNPGNNSRGVQIALFASCGSPWNPIQCITETSAACGNVMSYPTSQVFVANGLTIGNIYYFMLDGCGGSACTVDIDVVENCTATIAPWSATGITGPTTVCINTNNTYTVQAVAGATDYHWYINGMLEGEGPNMTSFTESFSMPGTYELCVDSSTDPCIPESESPPPTCRTITVLGPVEGNLTISPQPICPGGTVNLEMTGYDPQNTKHIIITNSAGTILQVTTGTSATFTQSPAMCATYNAWVYSYYPGTQTVPVVGNNISTVTCSQDCCIKESFPFAFTDTQAPVFDNPPGNITYVCPDLVPTIAPLTFTDNCIPAGSVTGTQVDAYTNCAGGTITRTWTKTDLCNNTVTHVQTITLEPTPIATIDIPDDITIECINIPPPSFNPVLPYNNGAAGLCLVSGTITPTRVDNIVNCAGTITFTWDTIDVCGRFIGGVQVYTVIAQPEATLLNPLANATIACVDIPPTTFLPPLNYDNFLSGNCQIAGSIIPTRVENITNCVGTITYTWSTTDPCNRAIFHQQILTVQAPPEAVLSSEPADMTIACVDIPAPGVRPPLTYTNGSTGNCLISGTIIPTRVDNIVNCVGTITYTWSATDYCNRPIFHQQILTVQAPPEAVLSSEPADMTIQCPDIPASGVLPPLTYTNGSSGNCLITGTIIPTRVDNIVNCVGTITYTWQATDYCNRPIYHQQILTVQAPPEAVLSSEPSDMTIQCPEIPAPGVRPPLTYTNGSTGNCLITGTIIPSRVDNIVNCVGTITYTWQATDYCNRPIYHQQILTVQAPPVAVLSSEPASMTIPCTEIPASGVLPPLTYTNGSSGSCLIMGTITPSRVDAIVNCEGTITYTWQATDYCNRPIYHQQILTVQAPPVAVLSAMPPDATIQCTEIPAPGVLPQLTYTNGSTGACLIQGTITPTRVDAITNCEGTITYTWNTTDYCNRPISHTQILTVVAPPVAVLSSLPASATINCNEQPAAGVLPPLTYTNNSTGSCLIAGTITPTRVDAITNCEGTITFTWNATDYCNRPITHTQVLTLLAPPQAIFVDAPASTTLDCSQVPPATFLPPLSYTNNFAACQIQGTIVPTRVDNIVNCEGTITLTWTFTDQCNRNITHTQVITITPPNEAFPVNPPANTTITCDQAPAPGFIPALNYSNNQTGSCEVVGTMTGTRVDNIVNCEGTITYTWTATDRCNRPIEYIQVLTLLPPPPAMLVDPPVYNTPISCAAAQTFTAPNIAYTNSHTCLVSGTLTPVVVPNFTQCGGFVNITWSGLDMCNRPLEYTQIIIVSPAPAPTINGPLPQDVTLACQDLTVLAVPLTYSNGLSGDCALTGELQATLTDVSSICGGVANITWSGSDLCGNFLTHTQNITVTPAAPPTFVSLPPPNVNTACGIIPTEIPSLAFSNGQNGICNIFGYAAGIQTGSYDACGGQITYTWQHTDQCGRDIVYSQNLNIAPASTPIAFLDEPGDINLPCGETENQVIELAYTNGLQGFCAFEGIASPVTQTFNSYYLNTWSFVHPCTNQEVNYTQRVNIIPLVNIVAEPTMVEICSGESFDLSSVVVTDLNFNTSITKTYHTGTPATNANKLASAIVSPSNGTTKYYIKASNVQGCFDEVEITIETIGSLSAGQGSQATECIDTSKINLWSYLSGSYATTGYWEVNSTQNIDISNPSSVFIGNVIPGSVTFWYIVEGLNDCPNDTAIVNINFIPAGSYTISEVKCDASLTTYSIKVSVSNMTLTSNVGSPTLVGNEYIISNIPIAQSATLTFITPNTNCSNEVAVVTPPNCNCPIISPPVGNDATICQSLPLALSVTVGSGLTANWYVSQTSTTPLATSVLQYSPSTLTPGVYTIYVEAVDPINNCKSNPRTAISYQVLPLPQANAISINACDDENDNFASFDLDGSKNEIANASNTIEFYVSNADATAGVNKLSSPYTNTTINQTIYAKVISSGGCDVIVPIQLTPYDPPSLNVTGLPEVCLDDKNGQIVASSSAGIEFRINSFPWSSSGTFTNLQAGSYQVQTRDVNGCANSKTFDVSDGQVLNIAQYSIICKNNGTTSISTDDAYEVTFEITNTTGVTNQFKVVFRGNQIGLFNYGQTNTINLPADAQPGLLEFIDLTTGCLVSKVLGSLNPCSTTCEITATNITFVCNDNNTASDASDDFYTVTLRASVLNGTNKFVVLVNDVIKGQYDYNSTISFILPADGQIPVIQLRDINDNACITNIPSQALTSCSGSCLLTKTVTNILCNDSGTINDPSDDVFYFDVRVTGFNTSATWKLQNDPSTHPYNTVVKLGPYPISAGNPNLIVVDGADNTCIVALPVTPPSPCSAPCVLEIVEQTTSACDDNDTGNDETDDVFSLDLNVKVVSGSANFYYVNMGTTRFGPFNYNQKVTIKDLPANGQNILLTIEDGINNGCQASLNVSKPSCSSCNQKAEAGADFTLTCSQNTATLNGSTASPSGIFVWTGPNNFIKTGASVTTSSPGTYILTISFPDGCKAIDSLKVVKDSSLPNALGGPDQVIDCEVSKVKLFGSSNLTSGIKIIWTNGAGSIISETFEVEVSTPGSYYLEIIDIATNCSSGKDEVVVKDGRTYPDAKINASPSNLIDCIIGTVTLSGTPQDNVQFDWQQGESIILNKNSIEVTQGGIVKLTVTDTISGCISTSSIQIIDLEEYPVINVKPIVPITCAQNYSLLDASSSPLNTNIVIKWLDGDLKEIPNASKDTLRVFTPGTYYVQFQDTINGCINIDTINVSRIGDFPNIVVSDDIVLYCGETKTKLNVQIINPSYVTSTIWSTIDGTIQSPINGQEVNVNGDGLYQVSVTYQSNGCTVIEQVNVIVNSDIPVGLQATTDNESCEGQNDGQINIANVNGGTPPYKYYYKNNEVDDLTALAPGTYSITIKDANGCQYDTLFTIKKGRNLDIEPISPIEILYNDDMSISISASTPDSSIASIQWSPSDGLSCDTCKTVTIKGEKDRVYTVWVTDIYGCQESIEVFVKVKDNTIITVPNVINTSSNSNNFFTAIGNDGLLMILDMSIYDRWGNLMWTKKNFAPNDPGQGWDGTYNGKLVEQGVYVYKIQYQTRFVMNTIAGDISVIR